MALLRGALIGIIFAYVTPSFGQQPSDFEREKTQAYRQFARGKLQDSIKGLQTLIGRAPTKLAAAQLERDLLEVCSTGYFFKCYFEAEKALFAAIQQNKDLGPLGPELFLYSLRESIWSGQKENVQDIIKKGGASTYIFPLKFPATYAEVQLTLHSVYVDKNDLGKAEDARSAAALGLLISDPRQTYTTCKILVGLLNASLSAQDIVGAYQLLRIVDPYITKNLSHESVLYAQYMHAVGNVFAFTDNTKITADVLQTAFGLFKKVDIAPEMRDFELSNISSLRSAALAISGKIEEAKKALADNPMHAHRSEIIRRGKFQTYQQFIYAVADVFVSMTAGGLPDKAWQPLFFAASIKRALLLRRSPAEYAKHASAKLR